MSQTYLKELSKRGEVCHTMVFVRKSLQNNFARGQALPPTSEAAFAQLHRWRDDTARKFDESWAYVLPSYMLFRIAEQLPLSEAALADVTRPLPPLVQHHAKDIVLLLQQAVQETAQVRADSAHRDAPAARSGAALVRGALSEAELYLLSSSAERIRSEPPPDGAGTPSWFPSSEGAPRTGRSTLFGEAEPSPQLGQSQTVAAVLASFPESLESMAATLLREHTRATAAADNGATDDATAGPEDGGGSAAASAASAASGPVVSLQQDVIPTDSARPAQTGQDGRAESDAGIAGLPPSIAEAHGMKSGSARRRSTTKKPSRHKRRREAAAKQAGTSAAQGEKFDPFMAPGPGAPAYDQVEAAKAPRTSAQQRSHTIARR